MFDFNDELHQIQRWVNGHHLSDNIYFEKNTCNQWTHKSLYQKEYETKSNTALKLFSNTACIYTATMAYLPSIATQYGYLCLC